VRVFAWRDAFHVCFTCCQTHAVGTLTHGMAWMTATAERIRVSWESSPGIEKFRTRRHKCQDFTGFA